MLDPSEAQNISQTVRNGIGKIMRAGLLLDDQRERIRREFKAAKEREDNLQVSLTDIDVTDIVDGFRLVRETFHDTKRMIGNQVYQKTDYSFLHDIRQGVREFYFGDPDDQENRKNHKTYNALYWLVLVPTINIFRGYSHEDALISIDMVIRSAIRFTKESDDIYDPDNAFVARVSIARDLEKRQVIAHKVAAILEMRNKKKKRKKRKRKENG